MARVPICYADSAYSHSFEFHDLPGGTYDLKVEVEGYQTWHGTRTVIPGQGKREDDRLVPTE